MTRIDVRRVGIGRDGRDEGEKQTDANVLHLNTPRLFAAALNLRRLGYGMCKFAHFTANSAA
jgi:hypothetical protein